MDNTFFETKKLIFEKKKNSSLSTRTRPPSYVRAVGCVSEVVPGWDLSNIEDNGKTGNEILGSKKNFLNVSSQFFGILIFVFEILYWVVFIVFVAT
jgi:hypothetical protein